MTMGCMMKDLFGGACFKRLIRMRELIIFLRSILRKVFFMKTLILRVSFFIVLFYGMSSPSYSFVSNNDYRSRHPILMQKVEKYVDIPLLAGRGLIKYPIHDTINGFLDQYQKDNAGVLLLMIPSPTVSSVSIKNAVKEIRKIIIARGVASKSISERLYDADYGLDIDTIRISYFAVKPSAGKCGFWPEDILGSYSENDNWFNYGCASQNNLAAQVVNPSDLFSPRAMTPPDAYNRDRSVDNYRNYQSGKSSSQKGGDDL
ncbi:CpaD family pilus assembly protein [Candidatus Liberibacter africanus]|nr:CpaD family pilus assembly protein [Candidatus Liberibacter africanus]